MNESRKAKALGVRVAAAELAASRPHPRHIANGDELKFRRWDAEAKKWVPSYLASFTKGMPHDYATGLVKDPADFQQFIQGIDSGDPRDFKDTRLGPVVDYNPKDPNNWRSKKAKDKIKAKNSDGLGLRAWESQAAGNTFDLEGPDAKAVTMPPAPALGSHELSAEMAEVYAQALLRDVPFTEISAESSPETYELTACEGKKASVPVKRILDALRTLPWFKADTGDGNGGNDGSTVTVPSGIAGPGSVYHLDAHERSRVRTNLNGQTLFRGITPGDDIGPYISQFMLAGSVGRDADEGRTPASGLINYGSITIDQRVQYATPCDDHMDTWDEWYDVQQAADFGGMESYSAAADGKHHRFITTPRDIATYVHYDELYEAYLNACILMLSHKIPFDPGLPFQGDNATDHQQAFAHFGGPHILSLVTEVATRALKAVRSQKFNVHRRFRPEGLAARLTRHDCLNQSELTNMRNELSDMLALVAERNGDDPPSPKGNYLLPMAFCEGSPMHPSYGAGHATVAGACVTILKAFFDHGQPIAFTAIDECRQKCAESDKGKKSSVDKDCRDAEKIAAFAHGQSAFVPSEDGSKLKIVPVKSPAGKSPVLTVEGELNKLASNIAIARDWAGVHFFTDYIESLRMGEQIALGILEEQKLTYGETFSMTVPLFDGGSIRI